jgi:hypothetical protein|mmetsp:Transcript_113829/g.179139  ORF Transcript_113829/g.179139 Transcript_113829/m.179139 type:complete len:262 (+) Transcript_113829:78-863(+)
MPRNREGIDEVLVATTMTLEEWKELQNGMDMTWPAPAYMSVNKRLPGESNTSYRDETYAIVTRWTAATKISYRPHAKAPGTKSHIRYEKYSKATTVGEALDLGTLPSDWCWDYERGFIRVHGPVLNEPLDVSKMQDQSNLTQVDMVISRWYRRELAKKGEITPGKFSMEGGTETTPVKDVAPKASKVRKVEPSGKENKSPGLVDLGSIVVQKAERAGMIGALLDLAMKMEIRMKNFSDEQLFRALQEAEGNVGKAQQALVT